MIFAHGSGSSRLSPRNRAVAATLQRAGIATLLFDLLTEREERRRELVFDIPLLARRLELVTRWSIAEPDTRGCRSATSARRRALRRRCARRLPRARSCVRWSRAGVVPIWRPTGSPHVTAPTLLIVGSLDPEVLELNRRAAAMLHCPHRLEVVDGAGHLFSEPGTLERVATLAAEWFRRIISPAPTSRARGRRGLSRVRDRWHSRSASARCSRRFGARRIR